MIELSFKHTLCTINDVPGRDPLQRPPWSINGIKGIKGILGVFPGERCLEKIPKKALIGPRGFSLGQH